MLDMDFLDSTFFKDQAASRSLPTPAEVVALSVAANANPTQPPPVRFEHLSLIVKFGPYVSVAEAQCLWAIKKFLGDRVRVPEVYAWRCVDGKVFIYMQLIHGKTLKERWETLTCTERTDICDQLCEITDSLRLLEQGGDAFIGMRKVLPLV